MSNMISYHSKLVGVSFEGRQEVIAELSGDEELRFRREPSNEYDPNAVAVDVLSGSGFVNYDDNTSVSVDNEWMPIGYIARDKNSELADIIDSGGKATIKISDVTGGAGKHYGVNVYIEHERKFKPIRSANAILVRDIFDNEIFYDDDLHQYTNALGESYLSGSKYAEQFESPFDAPLISSKMAAKYNLGSNIADSIQEMWNLKAKASTSFGTSMHAALELYGRFKGLSESMERETHLHDNPILRRAVESFYSKYPETLNIEYECLVVDHSKKRAGRIDRLEFDSDGVWIADFKTNADINKSLNKYWLQLSFYAAVLKANGEKVKGLKIYHYNGDDWDTIVHDVIDIDKK